VPLGLDIKGGVLAVYQAEQDPNSSGDFNSQMTATITRIQNLLASSGYTEGTVSKQGTNQIRVEVPGVSNPDDLLNKIGKPAQLKITASSDPTDDSGTVITGKQIVSASAVYDKSSQQYGVQLVFNAEGTTAFSTLTNAYKGSQIYIYLDKNDGNGFTVFSAPTVQNAIDDGKTIITGGDIKDQTTANQYAMQILSGTFSVDLSVVSNEVVSATLGADALTYGLIAGAIGLLIVMIFLIAYYRMLGLLACFALVFYTLLFVFFLQALPMVQLTLPGIAGIFLSLGMAIDGNIIIFERIKDEYRTGKRIPQSVKSGFKHALSAILDSNITTILACVVLYILGSGPVQGFAIVLLIGNVISMFSSLVLTRGLINMYLPFNSTRAKAFNLKREAVLNEAK